LFLWGSRSKAFHSQQFNAIFEQNFLKSILVAYSEVTFKLVTNTNYHFTISL